VKDEADRMATAEKRFSERRGGKSEQRAPGGCLDGDVRAGASTM